MEEEQGTSKPKAQSAPEPTKVTADQLTNDDIATLYNILYSGITVSAKLAKNVANLQLWTERLVEERDIPKESQKR